MLEIIFYISVGILGNMIHEREKTEYRKPIKNVPLVPKKPTKRVVSKSGDNGCETEITEIFYSKASGEIIVCKGKLLEAGQETKIRRVRK